MDEPKKQEPKKNNTEKGFFALSEDKKDVFLTPWSLVHFLSGSALKSLGAGFWTNFLIHGGYEVKDRLAHPTPYNSKFNSVGDQVCSMAGWYVVKKDPNWIIFFVYAYIAAALFADRFQIG
jgi:hypothetical protein